jgi:hypothetical protein
MAVVLTAIALLGSSVTPHEAPVVVREAHVGCQTHRCNMRVEDRRLRHKCDRGSVVGCIDRGAHLHRVSKFVLRRRAWCESRMSPGATNGQYMGLFQFGWPLWSTTPYHGHSPYSAKWSSLAAAWAERNGLSGHWSCR